MSVTSESPEVYDRQRVARAPAALVEMKVAVGVGAFGVLIACVGAIAYVYRVNLAETLLGARVLFNIPVSDTDALKVLFMTIQTVGATASGAFTAAVAFVFALVRWAQQS
jgi:hypothetical protein